MRQVRCVQFSECGTDRGPVYHLCVQSVDTSQFELLKISRQLRQKCSSQLAEVDAQSLFVSLVETAYFVVVHNLLHNVILGWDLLSRHNFLFNCSSESATVKLRLKQTVSVPPQSAVCMTVC